MVGLDLLQLGHRLLEPLGRHGGIPALARRVEGRIEPQCLVPQGYRFVGLPAGIGVQAAKIQRIDLFRKLGPAQVAERNDAWIDMRLSGVN